MREEKPQAENAPEENRNGEPGAIEKFVKSSTVSRNHSFDKIGRPLLHACALMAGFAFAKNARTHKGSEG